MLERRLLSIAADIDPGSVVGLTPGNASPVLATSKLLAQEFLWNYTYTVASIVLSHQGIDDS